jgi:hypothetical protein
MRSAKAIDTLHAVELSPFSRNIEQRRSEQDQDILIIEVDVQIPQYPVVDIRQKERVELIFSLDDNTIPRVLMLREDFPKTPHLLLEKEEKPRSLCLYDVSFDEVNITWTGQQFIHRIRNWLKLTAIGMLHQSDQPLEPLLLTNEGDILISYENLSNEFKLFHLQTRFDGRLSLIATNSREVSKYSQFAAKVEFYRGQPQVHGVINKAPEDLLELAQLLEAAAIPLVQLLFNTLKRYLEDKVNLEQKLLLIIDLPKIRAKESSEIEACDTFAFMTAADLREICIRIGLCDNKEGNFGYILGAQPTTEGLKTISIGILNPVFPYKKEFALKINTLPFLHARKKICAVGVGALGSNLSLNLIRAGIGEWVFIDSDLLYPHNLTRHALTGKSLLKYKAAELAIFANDIIKDVATSINADALSRKPDDAVDTALTNSDFVLDISASSSVLKALASQPTARIISASLNPRGNELVMFAEDEIKEYAADQLEVQYLRFIITTPELQNHFVLDKSRCRYGAGCRDISLNISQDNIAIASAIASKALKKDILESKDALLTIWKINDDTGEVHQFRSTVFKTLTAKCGFWTIKYDEYVIDKIEQLRRDKLPQETGGLVIGNYDTLRKIIYIADVMLSPQDSVEYPTAYIRGKKGIKESLKSIDDVSAGALGYIGEWHSHPHNCSTALSEDDLILFKWLKEKMSVDGYPALLLIGGDRKEVSMYVN